MRAFPDRVALGSWSTELGEVKTCLKAYSCGEQNIAQTTVKGLTDTSKPLRKSLFHGSSVSYA